MSLDTIVQINITAQSTSPSRAGFGTPLAAGFHTVFANRVRAYASGAEMVTDGFLATDPLVRLVNKVFSQNPKVTSIKIGRRASAPIQKLNFIPTDITVGLDYTMAFTRMDGTTETATYKVVTADTVALIIDGLITAIGALSGGLDMTPTDNVTDFDLLADVAGDLFNVVVNKKMDIKDTTVDPGLAADLAAIRAEDADWFGLLLDSNSEAECLAAAVFAEPLEVMFGCNSYDTEILDAVVVDDLFSDLKAAGHARTFPIWSGSVLSYAAAAWMGDRFPADPGTSTWAFKQLASVTVDTLSSAQQAAVEGKNGNHYNTVAGVNITFDGKVSAGEFIDIVRFISFLRARLQENVFALLVNLPKVPFTDPSVDLFKGEIGATIRRNEPDAIVPGTTVVTAPLVADISSTNRINRLLPDVKFDSQLAGAIHALKIDGVLTI
ncbi:hypothetical protein LCGC14_0375430 [marine sediment metagenome]|uniref:Uncharacterized protein n=1 Tax=marine sediment metagenome TaxID=412755 RepID=A0A0F9VR85_9ZZZZ